MSRISRKLRAGLIGATTLAAIAGTAMAGHADPAEPRSGGSGGHAGNWDGNAGHDVLARDARTGMLKVYPSVAGTLRSPVTIGDRWHGYRWTGTGDFDNDGFADALTISASGGVLAVWQNDDGLDGMGTLATPVIAGYGFDTVDLVTTGDINADGYTDVVARKAGTSTSYVYYNQGGVNGLSTFGRPQELMTTAPGVIEQVATDVNLDGRDDIVSVTSNGDVHARIFTADGDASHLLRTGWGVYDAVLAADIDGNGHTDLLSRRASDGVLVNHEHSGGFDPADPGATFGDPVPFSFGWQVNDQIS